MEIIIEVLGYLRIYWSLLTNSYLLSMYLLMTSYCMPNTTALDTKKSKNRNEQQEIKLPHNPNLKSLTVSWWNGELTRHRYPLRPWNYGGGSLPWDREVIVGTIVVLPGLRRVWVCDVHVGNHIPNSAGETGGVRTAWFTWRLTSSLIVLVQEV